MPKTNIKGAEKFLHLDTSAKNILVRSCLQLCVSYAHELITHKEYRAG